MHANWYFKSLCDSQSLAHHPLWLQYVHGFLRHSQLHWKSLFFIETVFCCIRLILHTMSFNKLVPLCKYCVCKFCSDPRQSIFVLTNCVTYNVEMWATCLNINRNHHLLLNTQYCALWSCALQTLSVLWKGNCFHWTTSAMLEQMRCVIFNKTIILLLGHVFSQSYVNCLVLIR